MATVVLTGTFEVSKAVLALYGSEGLTFNPSGMAQFPPTHGSKTTTLVDILVAAPFTQNGIDKYALLIGRDGAWGDCTGCPVPLRAAIFARQGSRWQVEWRDDNEDAQVGLAGHSPAGQLVQLGPNRYGFLFFETISNAGYSATTFLLYAPVANRLASILLIQPYNETMQTPGQPAASWELTSDYHFLAGSNPDYNDLIVDTTGTRPIDGHLMPVKESTTYAFQPGGGYSGPGYEEQASIGLQTPTPTPFTDPSFTIKKGLETLYRSFTGTVVTDQNVAYVPEEHPASGVLTWTVNVVLAAPYDEANRHKFAILTEWSQFERGDLGGCHLCGAALDGGVFVKSGQDWLLETRSISELIDTIGSWGHAPDGELVQIGPAKHGFLFYSYLVGQGYVGATFNLYAPVNGKIKRILSMPGFNEHYPELGLDWLIWGHDSIYQFRPGKNSVYYDLQINTTGLCLGAALTSTCGDRSFTFNGSEYVQTSGPPLPTPPSP